MQNGPLEQMDVSGAFLHGTLQEDVYMTQSLGLKDVLHLHVVCKLLEALYGLPRRGTGLVPFSSQSSGWVIDVAMRISPFFFDTRPEVNHCSYSMCTLCG